MPSSSTTCCCFSQTCWRGCKTITAGYALFLFNLIDLVVAVPMLFYACYLAVNHYAPSWLYQPLICLSVFLIFSIGVSWYGASHDSSNTLLKFSAWCFVLLAMAELILAGVITLKGPALSHFLETHQQELHISDAHLQELEANKFIPAYFLVGLFVMENFRFFCSGGLISIRKSREYKLLESSNRALEATMLEAQRREGEISEKYRAMRDNYRQKHQGQHP